MAPPQRRRSRSQRRSRRIVTPRSKRRHDATCPRRGECTGALAPSPSPALAPVPRNAHVARTGVDLDTHAPIADRPAPACGGLCPLVAVVTCLRTSTITRSPSTTWLGASNSRVQTVIPTLSKSVCRAVGEKKTASDRGASRPTNRLVRRPQWIVQRSYRRRWAGENQRPADAALLI